MIRIVLLQPRSLLVGEHVQDETVDGGQQWQLCRPHALFILADSLSRRNWCKVEIVDFEKECYRNLSIEAVLSQKEADIFGITATTYTRFEAVAIAKLIRRIYPSALIIAGGCHFGHCAEDTLLNVPEIDIVVRGDGENAIVSIADYFRGNVDLKSIPGISYRQGSTLVSNANSKDLPDPNVTGINIPFSWDDYPEFLFGVADRIRATSIMSSRGCPYQCIFCSKRLSPYRVRNVANVVHDIEMLADRLTVKGINFLDLSFTVFEGHTRALCSELMTRNLDILWWCESRANINLDLLDLMRKAGCISLALGVESGSRRVLSTIKKQIQPEQVMSFCKRCKSLGISVTAMFSFSFPDETEEDVKMTIDFMDQLGQYATCQIQPAMIFPGAELEQIALSRSVLPANFSWYEPVDSGLNHRLGQLANVPIYVDLLSPDFMAATTRRAQELSLFKYASELTWPAIVMKTWQCLTVKRQIPSYVNLRFIKKLLSKKFMMST